MKLELGLFNINNIIPNDRTFIQDRSLSVDLNELKQIIASDRRFSKIIAGESLPLTDTLQPGHRVPAREE